MSEEKRNDVNEDVIEVNPTPAIETEPAESAAEPAAPEQPVAATESVIAAKPVEPEQPAAEVPTMNTAFTAEPAGDKEPAAPEPVIAAKPMEPQQPSVAEIPVMNTAFTTEPEPAVKAEPRMEFHPPYANAPKAQKRHQDDGTTGKTVAALILGITAVSLSFTVFLSIFGLASGIVGLILAIKERKEHPSGLATAAFILSLIGLVASAISAVACVACVGFFGWADSWGAFDDPGTMHMFDGSMDI